MRATKPVQNAHFLDIAMAFLDIRIDFWSHFCRGVQNSTPNMAGRRSLSRTEVIPRRPWKSKSPFASRPMKRARHDAVLLPFISIVPSTGRPVISAAEKTAFFWDFKMHFSDFGVSWVCNRSGVLASLELSCTRKFIPIRIVWGFLILLWPGPCNDYSKKKVQKVTQIDSRE